MIIKSLGRKASAKMTGAGRVRNPFAKLVAYMTREEEGEHAESVLWHGFYGHAGMTNEDIVREFEANAKHLKERKNGNVLYHEILSFSRGYTLEGEALHKAIADIGQEYLRYRAPSQMAFGAIHKDTEHIHLHLMVSANAIGKKDREWFTKQEFADLQKALEHFVLTKYPELAQTKVYDRPRHKERLKTQAHEQAMKSRTGEPSNKERAKATLHKLFAEATDRADLEERMRAAGYRFYQRGKTIGVIEQERDKDIGIDIDEHQEQADTRSQTKQKTKSTIDRKHRLATLGLDTHYQATIDRFQEQNKDIGIDKDENPKQRQQNQAHQPNQHEQTQDESMSEKHPSDQGEGKDSFGTPPPQPSAMRVVGYEFLTGKLHDAWHGKKEPEPPTIDEHIKGYTDPILKRIQEIEAGERTAPSQQIEPTQQATPPQKQAKTQTKTTPSKDNDRER